MKIAIVGGGWYGCHIAATMQDHGAEIDLYEKTGMLLSEASGNNQFRLHLGLHYARSSVTRRQSLEGFNRFISRYPTFQRPIDRNIYLVPKTVSVMDFETYFLIMNASGIHVERFPVQDLAFLRAELFEGALICDERVVLTSCAREHFEQKLARSVNLDTVVPEIHFDRKSAVVNGKQYDWAVDATWGALSHGSERLYFEPTILLYYRQADLSKTWPAITLVDGEHWSLYPTECQSIFTLSSVMHTPLGQYETKSDAYRRLEQVRSDEIESRVSLIEQQVSLYFPSFSQEFKFVQPQFSIKTKPLGFSDDRSASVTNDGRLFRVRSGKIDTIFHATDIILKGVFGG